MKRMSILLIAVLAVGWFGYTRLIGGLPTTEPASTEPPAAWPSDDPDVVFSAPG